MEELVRRNRALVGVDGGAQGHHSAGVTSRRVVVSDRATHGAHGAHLLVANASGQRCKCGDMLFDIGVVLDILVAHHGTDDDVVAVFFDAFEFGNLA